MLDFLTALNLECMRLGETENQDATPHSALETRLSTCFLASILKKKTGNCEESRSFKRMWSFLAIIFVFGFCIIILFKSYLYNTAEKCLCQ